MVKKQSSAAASSSSASGAAKLGGGNPGGAFVRVNQVTVVDGAPKTATKKTTAAAAATKKKGATKATKTTAAAATSTATPKAPKVFASDGTGALIPLKHGSAKKNKKSKAQATKWSSKYWWKKVRPYIALQLRNLPAAFQEPQLRKFLSQFGVPIKAMYVVRTKKSRTSRGLAYVAFDPRGNNSHMQMLDIVLDECDNMNLGGRTVSAKWVKLHRRMPNRKAADATRQLEYLRKTEGVKLHRHDMTHYNWIERLQRAAKNEAAGNTFLRELNVAYSFDGFGKQAALLTPELKSASKLVQGSVAVARVGTAAARKHGFSNTKMIQKALAGAAERKKTRSEKQRKSKKAKKAAAKEQPAATAAAAAAAAASTTTQPAAAMAADKKPVAPKSAPAGKKSKAAAPALATSLSGKKAPAPKKTKK